MGVLTMMAAGAMLAAAPGAAAPVAAAAAPGAAALAAGLDAFQRQDQATARRLLRPLADRGSAIAETLLGLMTAAPVAGPADPASAAGWWLRAANRGYAPAQLALARALAEGRGVARDDGKAWVWARLAATAGTGTTAPALALAGRLERGFTPAERARLEAERAAWRPWPGA